MPKPLFPPVVDDHGGLYASPDNIWELVSSFATRTLSFEEDTLSAMQGIFGVWREGHGVSFLYGLPIPRSDDLETEPSGSSEGSPPLRQYNTRYNALLRSLFWEDNWDSRLPHWVSPSSNPRRAFFPNWTWAGWKRSKRQLKTWSCGTSTSSVLLTPNYEPIKVSFAFDDITLDWIPLADRAEILRRSDASHFPTCLVITAQVFDVTITCETRYKYYKNSGSVSWGFASPPFMQNIDRHSLGLNPPKLPPGLFKKVEGDAHRLLAIPLFTGVEPLRDSVHILLLRNVGQDDDDRPIFERVKCFSL